MSLYVGFIGKIFDQSGGGGVPADEFDDVTTVKAGSNTVNIPFTSGQKAGDELIVILTSDRTDGANMWNTPAGWTLLDHDGDTASDATFTIFTKISDGLESGNLTITASVALNYVAMMAYKSDYRIVMRNWSERSSTGTNQINHGIRTQFPDDFIMSIWCFDGGDAGYSAAPTDMKLAVADGQPVGSGTGSSLLVATESPGTVGMVPDRFTTSAVNDGFMAKSYLMIKTSRIPTVSPGPHRHWRLVTPDNSGDNSGFGTAYLKLGEYADQMINHMDISTTVTVTQAIVSNTVHKTERLWHEYEDEGWETGGIGRVNEQMFDFDFGNRLVEINHIEVKDPVKQQADWTPSHFMVLCSNDGINWEYAWTSQLLKAGTFTFSANEVKSFVGPWAVDSANVNITAARMNVVLGRGTGVQLTRSTIHVVLKPV